MRRWAAVVFVLPLLCVSRFASAQVVTEPGAKGWVPPPEHFEAFRPAVLPVLGLDAGLGFLKGTCESCPLLGGAMAAAFAGLIVHPRVAVIADVRATLHPLPTLDELADGLLVNVAYSGAAQVWITPTLWLRAGAGVTAQHFVVTGPDDSRWGPAVVLAFGSEQRHKRRSGVDLAVHLAITRFDTGTLFVVTPAIGGHWH